MKASPRIWALLASLLLFGPVLVDHGFSRPISNFFVLADFYDGRMNREFGGENAAWHQARRPLRSERFSNEWQVRQADLVDATGRPQLASLDFPQIGMYSVLDEAAAEYFFLLARTASIDAFLLENLDSPCYPLFKKMSEKFGVDLYGALEPKRVERFAKKQNLQGSFSENARAYLAPFLREPTWPTRYGRPLVHLWNFPREERLKASTWFASDGVNPLFFQWVILGGRLENDSARFDSISVVGSELKSGLQFQPWIPSRLRPWDEAHPSWDRYANTRDSVDYLTHLRSELSRYSENQIFPVSLVTPGFDNRPCAGWDRDLSFLDREGGGLYEAMWKETLANTNHFQSVYIATFNDWTESSSIEPSEKMGLREMRTTQKYARLCKGLPALDEKLLELPLRLFRIRKSIRFLGRLGLPVEAASARAEKASLAISRLDGSESATLLGPLEQDLEELRQKGVSEKNFDEVILQKQSGKNAAWRLPAETLRGLGASYWEGFLFFEWKDDGRKKFTLRGNTARPKDTPGSDYAVVASLMTTDTGAWVSGAVPLLQTNLVFPAEGAHFESTGEVEIRNLRARFTVFRAP